VFSSRIDFLEDNTSITKRQRSYERLSKEKYAIMEQGEKLQIEFTV